MRSYQVVEFGHTLRDTDMLDPKPTGDEVVIAVKAAGVCHSDLHIWGGGFDLGGGRKLTLKDRGVQLPLTLGHETAGEILSIGPNVTDRKVGEMCLVYPWIGCVLICDNQFGLNFGREFMVDTVGSLVAAALSMAAEALVKGAVGAVVKDGYKALISWEFPRLCRGGCVCDVALSGG